MTLPPAARGADRRSLRGELRSAARWLALVAALVTVDVALLHRRFFFGNDDLWQFAVARDEGLSWTTLALNVWQHFGPYNRLGHLLVHRVFGLDPAAGTALMAFNLAAVLLGALWLMTELGLSIRRRVVGLVLTALSVSTLESAIWFDASMHVLPAVAVVVGVCAAHVRAVRLGRVRWHVVTGVLFVLGQLTQERPLFALPLLLLVDVLLLWRHLPWGARLRRLWLLRVPLTVMATAALVVVVALQSFVVVESYPTPGWGTTGRAVLASFSDYVLPSLVNLPRAQPTSTGVQLVVVAVALAVGVVLVRLERQNAGPLIFAAAVFLLFYAFLKFSPLLAESTVTANAERLTNATYATVPAVVGLVHLKLPRWSRPPTSPVLRRASPVALTALLAGYLVVTANAYLDARWPAAPQVRAWLDTVRAEQDEWSDPGVTVLPLNAPAAMATGWSRPFGRHEQVLSMVRRGFTPGSLGPATVLIDDRGEVRPAALAPVASATVTGDGCSGDPAQVIRVGLDGVARGEPFFLVVRYTATAETDVVLGAQTPSGPVGGLVPTRLPAGSHVAAIPVEATTVQALVVRLDDAGRRLCVHDATLARAVVVVDGVCRDVDRFGRPGSTTACPDARSALPGGR